MRQYYAARFANAADFTYFFVGAFTVDEITPLLEKILLDSIVQLRMAVQREFLAALVGTHRLAYYFLPEGLFS